MNEQEAIREVLDVARDLVEADPFSVKASKLMKRLRDAVGVLERCGHYECPSTASTAR